MNGLYGAFMFSLPGSRKSEVPTQMHLRDKFNKGIHYAGDLVAASAISTYAALSARREAEVVSDDITTHFLIEGDPKKGLSPAARYRAWQYVPLLRELGLKCEVHASRPTKYFAASHSFGRLHRRFPRLATAWAISQYLRQYLNRIQDFRQASQNAVVFLQRDLVGLSHSKLEHYLPLFNRKIIFDFDDAIFVSPSWCEAPGQEAIDKEVRAKIEHIIKLSSAVTTANPFLAEFARQYCDDVHVLPTTLCTDEFHPPLEKVQNKVPVIGWIGTSGNLYYLRKLSAPLRALAKRREFVLRIICNQVPKEDLPDLPPANMEFVEWNSECEIQRIQELDIGIMPLEDDEWTRGKAGFKLIQYMACGVPIVWSPVGANPDVAGEDGVCGYAAKKSADWVDGLQNLIDDRALRQGMGAKGRLRAQQVFDRRMQVGKLASIIRRVGRGY